MPRWIPDDDYGGRYQPPPPEWFAPPPKPPPVPQQWGGGAPPSPPGGGGGWSPGLPSWITNLEADPSVIAARTWETSGIGQLDAQLKALREKAIIDWGDESMAGAAGFGLDPSAAEFARQNYASGIAGKARLEKAQKDRRRAIINRLASRGILRSGETGFQEGEASLLGAQELSDAKSQLLNFFQNAQSQNLDRKMQLRQAVIAALTAAAASRAGNPALWGSYGAAPLGAEPGGVLDVPPSWGEGGFDVGPGGFDPDAWRRWWENRGR